MIPQSTMILLVSRLLELSAVEFEFPLASVIPDVDQRRSLIQAVHDQFPALGAFDPERVYETWSAWHLARFVAVTCAAESGTFESLELATKNGITFAPLALASTAAEAVTDAGLLEYLGTDPLRWATSCIDHAHKADKVDESFLLGWFANAIEAGKLHVLRNTEAPEPSFKSLAPTAIEDGLGGIQISVPPGVDPAPIAEKVAAVMREQLQGIADEVNARTHLDDAPVPHAILDAIAENGNRRQNGSRWDGLETDEEVRTRMKRDRDNGVGPGTEFPNLEASPLTVTDPDGTVHENIGIGISRREKLEFRAPTDEERAETPGIQLVVNMPEVRVRIDALQEPEDFEAHEDADPQLEDTDEDGIVEPGDDPTKSVDVREGLAALIAENLDAIREPDAPVEEYRDQAMVEGVLGKPDGAVTDSSGNVVGGMWENPRFKRLREATERAVAYVELGGGGPMPLTRAVLDTLEKQIAVELGDAEAIVAVEGIENAAIGDPRIKIEALIGGTATEITR